MQNRPWRSNAAKSRSVDSIDSIRSPFELCSPSCNSSVCSGKASLSSSVDTLPSENMQENDSPLSPERPRHDSSLQSQRNTSPKRWSYAPPKGFNTEDLASLKMRRLLQQSLGSAGSSPAPTPFFDAQRCNSMPDLQDHSNLKMRNTSRQRSTALSYKDQMRTATARQLAASHQSRSFVTKKKGCDMQGLSGGNSSSEDRLPAQGVLQSRTAHMRNTPLGIFRHRPQYSTQLSILYMIIVALVIFKMASEPSRIVLERLAKARAWDKNSA
jgi:hypothetical protein